METIYSWIIKEMYTKPSEDGLTDVVVNIEYIRRAVNGDFVVEYPCNMPCNTPNPNNFTPYQNLTYEQVCSWLDEGTDLVFLDNNLNNQIDLLLNPPSIILPNPWDPIQDQISTPISEADTTINEIPIV